MRDITASDKVRDDREKLAQFSVLILDGRARSFIQGHQHELLSNVQPQQLQFLKTQHIKTVISILNVACTILQIFCT